MTLESDVMAGWSVDEVATAIYKAYPRHVGKGAAMRAIKKALKKTDGAKLLVTVKDYAAATETWPKARRFTRDGADTVPHPSTWFNQERWEDDQHEWRCDGRRVSVHDQGLGTDSRPARL